MLAASLTLALGLAEIGLRLLDVKFDASLYGDDPITGWRLRPNAQGWWVSENKIYTRINSAGTHDREYPLRKPPQTLRLAVLGDSMTAAIQVDVEDTFTRVLERELGRGEAFRGRNVEVMNFGVPGFGTAQQLLQFRHQVIHYSPDILLLAFFPYNDVHNNYRALNPVDAAKSPYFVLQRRTGFGRRLPPNAVDLRQAPGPVRGLGQPFPSRASGCGGSLANNAVSKRSPARATRAAAVW